MIISGVVLIRIPVSENAADTTENAGIGRRVRQSVHQSDTRRFISHEPATVQLALLALTVVTYLTSAFLCHCKTVLCCHWKVLFLRAIRRTERDDRASKMSAFSNNLHRKVAEDVWEIVFYTLVWYADQYLVSASFGIGIDIRKKKIVSEHL